MSGTVAGASGAAHFLGGWFHTYTETRGYPIETIIESAQDAIDQMREDEGIVLVDTRDEATVERLAQALFSHAHPGHSWQFEARGYKDEFRKEARAVLAVLGQ
jgi:hypothetical protein